MTQWYRKNLNDAYRITYTEKFSYAVLEDGSVIIYALEPIYVDGHETLECRAFAHYLEDGLATVVGFSHSYSRPWDWMSPDLTDKDIVGYSGSLESAMDLYEPGLFVKETKLADDDNGGFVWIDENDRDKAYTLVIPNRLDGYPVVAIYDGAFEEAGFSGVTFPESVTSIGGEAFMKCGTDLGFPNENNFALRVKEGGFFSEILDALGDTGIAETWLELPIYTAFMVRYRLGNADYNFIAFEEDEPVHILWIHQLPYLDDDGE